MFLQLYIFINIYFYKFTPHIYIQTFVHYIHSTKFYTLKFPIKKKFFFAQRKTTEKLYYS